MTVGLARAVRLAPARTCADCLCWPCRCTTDDAGFMPEFALRIEPCACGSAIAGGGSAQKVRLAVELHNATPRARRLAPA